MVDSAQEILRKYWGYDSFRPLQREVIEAVLEGKDVMALMPTGGGKSLCFQIPALLQEGVTLVVSPLIALMQDQVEALKRRGIRAEALYTGMSTKAMDVVLDNCVYGSIKLLYISPERLHTELFRVRVAKIKVSMLVVDEAHCVSQWGHDFRPSYQRIATIKGLLGNGIPTLALTATATAEVKEDMIKYLSMQSPLILQKSFVRSNLAWSAQQSEDKAGALYSKLMKHLGSAIVYVSTRRYARWVADYLSQRGIGATYYHAGLSLAERTKRQGRWLQDGVRVMVATNAFGMGINKADVRCVVHLYFPTTLEAYYQEAGRAGRDGKAAVAVVIYEDGEVEKLRTRIVKAYPQAKVLKELYQKLANYYQVAVGSHGNVTYRFDLEDFMATYGLGATTLYNGLKRLEEADLIKYNDRSAISSKVHIKMDSKGLYAFQLSNPEYRPLLKALSQCYASIFTALTPFSTQRMAKYIGAEERMVKRQLKALDELGVLVYLEEKGQATFTFLTPRYESSALPIAADKLAARKALMMKKGEDVIFYMTHTQRCRMQLLLEYLGEVSYVRCGHCDICVRGRLVAVDRDGMCEKKIKRLLVQGPLLPKVIVARLEGYFDSEKVVATIKGMVDDGILKYMPSFEVMLSGDGRKGR